MNYYCLFCDQRCKKTHPEASWWKCRPCKVSFHDDGTNGLWKISFSVNKPDALYTLDLLLNENKTELYVLGRDPVPSIIDSIMNGKLTISLPSIMQNVNPNNVADKVKTLLVFS